VQEMISGNSKSLSFVVCFGGKTCCTISSTNTVNDALAWKAAMPMKVVKRPKPEVGTWHYQPLMDIHKAELLSKPH